MKHVSGRSILNILSLTAAGLFVVACGGDSSPDTGAAAMTRDGTVHPHSLVRTLSDIAAEHTSDGDIPGVVMSVSENGATVFAGGFGLADKDGAVPMTADTFINVASVSKSVSAWGFLKLLDERAVRLDDSVIDLFSTYEFDTGEHPADGITHRRVLSHTAGLSTPSVPVVQATTPMPAAADILDGRAGGTPRVTVIQEPGTRFSYSGGGYLLLQLAWEETTGEAFAHYMKREVLTPAGMTESEFGVSEKVRGRVSRYYRSLGRERALYHLPAAAGGLYSTAHDMGAFMNLYAPGAGADILPRELRRLMSGRAGGGDASAESGAKYYGLGHWVLATDTHGPILFHAGGNPGLRAVFIVVPKSGNGLFVAANHDDGNDVITALTDAWAKHYGYPAIPFD